MSRRGGALERLGTLALLLMVPSLAIPLADARPAAAAPTADAPAAPSPAVAGYDGGFFLRAPDAPFSLKVNGLLQARFAYDVLDGADDEAAFSIPRGRLSLGGHAFTEALTFKLQVDFGKGAAALKDYFANLELVPRWLALRAGQFKRPFSRQLLTSASRLALVDRSITDGYFATGRDLGVMLHNGFGRSPGFEWALGVFNGTGDRGVLGGAVTVDPATGEGSITSGRFSNVPDMLHPALALRVGYNHGRVRGYDEADLAGGPLRFAVAASLLADLDADDDERSQVQAEFDVILKIAHFSASGAVFVATAQDGAGFGDQSFAAWGFHVQAGHVFADLVQPVVRYARIAPDGGADDRQEILGGVALLFFDHGLKWQVDGGAILTETAGVGRSDYLVRTQLQLAF